MNCEQKHRNARNKMNVCSIGAIRIESDKTTSIYNVSTRVLSKK